MPHRFAVLLAAAGKSRRFADGGPNVDNAGGNNDTASKKPFVDLCGRPVWQHGAALFAAEDRVRQLIVVLSPEDRAFFERTYSRQIAQWSLELADGGAERFESIENGLRRVRSDMDFVAIHDAARPCVSAQQIDAVFRAAEQFDAAILAAPLAGTIKRAVSPNAPAPGATSAETSTGASPLYPTTLFDIAATVPRDDLWEAQTPQVFRRELIVDALSRRGHTNVTDDAQLVENIGHPVKIVPSDRTNLKITTASDLALARLLMVNRPERNT